MTPPNAEQVKGLDVIRTTRRQEGVNACQFAVKGGRRPVHRSFTGGVIENIIAGVLGTALLAYLVYALVRPERF